MTKETYITINEDCDAIDKLCVICLETMDGNQRMATPRHKMLKCECECKYYIHKSCFDKWLANRPNNVSCLICLSKAKPVTTPMDIVKKCCYVRYERVKILCHTFISWVLCFISLCLMLRFIEDSRYKYEE